MSTACHVTVHRLSCHCHCPLHVMPCHCPLLVMSSRYPVFIENATREETWDNPYNKTGIGCKEAAASARMLRWTIMCAAYIKTSVRHAHSCTLCCKYHSLALTIVHGYTRKYRRQAILMSTSWKRLAPSNTTEHKQYNRRHTILASTTCKR